MLSSGMAQMRISVAASLLGVSDDTLRRWVEAGRLSSSLDEQGRRVVDGAERTREVRGCAEATGDVP